MKLFEITLTLFAEAKSKDEAMKMAAESFDRIKAMERNVCHGDYDAQLVGFSIRTEARG